MHLPSCQRGKPLEAAIYLILRNPAWTELGGYWDCCLAHGIAASSIMTLDMLLPLLPAGVEYGSRNVLQDPDLREGVKQYSEWPTIPQVFVNGEFIGGSDILMNLHESGDLKKMFLDKQ